MINIRKPNDKLSTTLKSTMHLNSTEKLTKWLASETEIQKSRAIHREALDQLVAERIRLRQEIISLKVLLLEQKNHQRSPPNKFYFQGRKYWEGPAIKRQRLKEISRVENEVKIQSDRIQELEKIIASESGNFCTAWWKYWVLIVNLATDAQKGVSRWSCISNLNDARVVMETLMQNYVQSDRDLAAANERLTEREFSMEKEIKRLREQLKQQEQPEPTVEPKVRLGIVLNFPESKLSFSAGSRWIAIANDSCGHPG